MTNQNTPPQTQTKVTENKVQNKASLRKSVVQMIIKQVEAGTGFSITELKKNHTEEQLFILGLKHVTTTKKAYCEAMDIPVEAGCRYKRHAEKQGILVQSIEKRVCPYSGYLAHFISTNPSEFLKLNTPTAVQTTLIFQ